MERRGAFERMRYGAVQCAGLGFVAGGFESVYLATSLKLPLSFARFVALGVADMAVMGLVAMGFGAVAGLVHVGGRDTATRMAVQIAGCTLLLTGWFLWQGAYWTWTDGQQPPGAAAMAAMPLGFAGVAFFNARYGYRRAERTPPSVGWLPISGIAGLALVLVASVLAVTRDTGGAFALSGDDNLLLVTVDGLRHDQVGFLGGPATPALDGMAAEGIVYANAVTPTPSSRGANATVLVGLHPLRSKVLTDADPLSRAYRSLFETLAAEGWATGGFVSSAVAEAGSGLDQGFLTYDDDFVPALVGIGRINVVAHGLALLQGARAASQTRPAADTVGRFETWLAGHADRPFAAWIHLVDPHRAAVEEVDPALVVADVDAAVGRALAALANASVADHTLVVVAGTHGELLGAHGGQTNLTLYDEVVRVPLVIRAPGVPVTHPRIDAQVRLMDVANTALQWLELDRMDASEGIELISYAVGERIKTIWCPLVGQDLDGDWLVGLRNNGVKYVRHPDGRQELYHVGTDPTEAHDVAPEQADTLAQARTLLAGDAAALDLLQGY